MSPIRMPTVHREKGYRLMIYPSDRGERAHVHVLRDRKRAKVWLTPKIRVFAGGRYSDHEINEILRIVSEERDRLLGAWRRVVK